MVYKDLIIKNKLGLHARPAGTFSKEAMKFTSEVCLVKDDIKYNAKSILGVLSMCVKFGDKVGLWCEGPDENEALSFLSNLMESGIV